MSDLSPDFEIKPAGRLSQKLTSKNMKIHECMSHRDISTIPGQQSVKITTVKWSNFPHAFLGAIIHTITVFCTYLQLKKALGGQEVFSYLLGRPTGKLPDNHPERADQRNAAEMTARGARGHQQHRRRKVLGYDEANALWCGAVLPGIVSMHVPRGGAGKMTTASLETRTRECG